jgi:hypothetical protein
MTSSLRDKYQFSWKGGDNPNDPAGVARFAVGHESVTVIMDNFSQAAKLNRLIEKACDWERQETIDRSIAGLCSFFNQYRYD